MPEEKYPLVVESVGGDTYIVMSGGHHDLDKFMAEVIKDYQDWNLGGAQHVWIKTTPAKGGWSYNIVEQATRGAWPATYCWEYGEGYENWRIEPYLSPALGGHAFRRNTSAGFRVRLA